MVQPTPRKRTKKADAFAEEAGAVRISVIVTKEQRQKLKVLAASRGVTISEVVRQGIARFLGGSL
jgi:hypothetical protein